MNAHQHVRVPEPVDWRQGMLISPQHFQQQDVYMDRLTTHKMFVSQPNYWGLIDIEVNESDLRSEKIVIERLHGILRDGQIIEMGDGARLEAVIPEALAEGKSDGSEAAHIPEAITVSVGVFRSGSSTDQGVQQRPQKRFDSFNCPDVADENNANLTVDMRKKKVVVQIFLGDDIPGIYETIPLFKVVAGHNGYKVASSHPPMLDVKVSKSLFKEESLWQKTQQLISSIRSKAADMAGTGFNGSAEAKAMSAMLAKVPAIEVLLNMNMVHPFQLYMAMVDLAASVNSLSLANKPMIPPGYDHDRPEKGFKFILDRLKLLVDRIEPDFRTYVFFSEEPGMYEIDLPEGISTKELLIKLVPEEGQHSSKVSSWIESAKVGPEAQMKVLRRGRLKGFERQLLDADRRIKLKLSESDLIFSLTSGTKGGVIKPNTKLQIHGKRESHPGKIYLCVPK